MDTTSNALSRILHLLALHPDVQEKARKEIIEALGGDFSDLPYDDLVKLPYLDAVIRATLRLYAPVGLSPRMYIASRTSMLPHANSSTSQGEQGHSHSALRTHTRAGWARTSRAGRCAWHDSAHTLPGEQH